MDINVRIGSKLSTAMLKSRHETIKAFRQLSYLLQYWDIINKTIINCVSKDEDIVSKFNVDYRIKNKIIIAGLGVFWENKAGVITLIPNNFTPDWDKLVKMHVLSNVQSYYGIDTSRLVVVVKDNPGIEYLKSDKFMKIITTKFPSHPPHKVEEAIRALEYTVFLPIRTSGGTCTRKLIGGVEDLMHNPIVKHKTIIDELDSRFARVGSNTAIKQYFVTRSLVKWHSCVVDIIKDSECTAGVHKVNLESYLPEDMAPKLLQEEVAKLRRAGNNILWDSSRPSESVYVYDHIDAHWYSTILNYLKDRVSGMLSVKIDSLHAWAVRETVTIKNMVPHELAQYIAVQFPLTSHGVANIVVMLDYIVWEPYCTVRNQTYRRVIQGNNHRAQENAYGTTTHSISTNTSTDFNMVISSPNYEQEIENLKAQVASLQWALAAYQAQTED